MKHIAAYLLAVMGGNSSPSVADITTILASVGIDADKAQLKKVVKELEDKDPQEVIAEGMSKLASVSSGSAAAPAAAGAASGSAAAPAAAKEEEAKEESDEDIGFGLFD